MQKKCYTFRISSLEASSHECKTFALRWSGNFFFLDRACDFGDYGLLNIIGSTSASGSGPWLTFDSGLGFVGILFLWAARDWSTPRTGGQNRSCPAGDHAGRSARQPKSRKSNAVPAGELSGQRHHARQRHADSKLPILSHHLSTDRRTKMVKRFTISD